MFLQDKSQHKPLCPPIAVSCCCLLLHELLISWATRVESSANKQNIVSSEVGAVLQGPSNGEIRGRPDFVQDPLVNAPAVMSIDHAPGNC